MRRHFVSSVSTPSSCASSMSSSLVRVVPAPVPNTPPPMKLPSASRNWSMFSDVIQPLAPGALCSSSASPSSDAGSGCRSAQAERASKIDFAGLGASSVLSTSSLPVGASEGIKFRSNVSKSSSEFMVSASCRLNWRIMAVLDS